MYLLNACTQSLRQNEKWELLNDVCANVSLKLLIIFVSKDLLLISINWKSSTRYIFDYFSQKSMPSYSFNDYEKRSFYGRTNMPTTVCRYDNNKIISAGGWYYDN